MAGSSSTGVSGVPLKVVLVALLLSGALLRTTDAADQLQVTVLSPCRRVIECLFLGKLSGTEQCVIQYGKDHTSLVFSDTSAEPTRGQERVQLELSQGLEPSTTYYYQARTDYGNGTVGTFITGQFSTPSACCDAPQTDIGQPVDSRCGSLDTPFGSSEPVAGGVVCYTDTSPGAHAVLLCDEGDSGGELFECGGDGSWDGGDFLCSSSSKSVMRNIIVIAALVLFACLLISSVAICVVLIRMWQLDPKRLRGAYYPQENEKKLRRLHMLDRDEIQVLSNTFNHSVSFTYPSTPYFTYGGQQQDST